MHDNIEKLLEAFTNGWETMSYDDEHVVEVRDEMLKLTRRLVAMIEKRNTLIKGLADYCDALLNDISDKCPPGCRHEIEGKCNGECVVIEDARELIAKVREVVNV